MKEQQFRSPENQAYFQVWSNEKRGNVTFMIDHSREYKTKGEAIQFLETANGLPKSAQVKECRWFV